VTSHDQPEGERLQKVLARAGHGSRRSVEEMISAGRIKVNGKRARLGQRVDPSKDQVEVDGSTVPLDSDLAYYLLNKPEGVVSTAADDEGRMTVVDLVPVEMRVYPVGRLDIDSEGAILLTNDGTLTQALTHPSFGFPKTYMVEVEGAVGGRGVKILSGGVDLDDGRTAPAEVTVIERGPRTSLLEITITEGRNRQIRRMTEAIGHPTVRLVRTAIGPLVVGRLKPGTFRRLGPAEVKALYAAAGL
jgi:23S rRNA pseudouridine2605 synthase